MRLRLVLGISTWISGQCISGRWAASRTLPKQPDHTNPNQNDMNCTHVISEAIARVLDVKTGADSVRTYRPNSFMAEQVEDC